MNVKTCRYVQWPLGLEGLINLLICGLFNSAVSKYCIGSCSISWEGGGNWHRKMWQKAGTITVGYVPNTSQQRWLLRPLAAVIYSYLSVRYRTSATIETSKITVFQLFLGIGKEKLFVWRFKSDSYFTQRSRNSFVNYYCAPLVWSNLQIVYGVKLAPVPWLLKLSFSWHAYINCLLLLSIGPRWLMPRMYCSHLAYCTTLRRSRSHR